MSLPPLAVVLFVVVATATAVSAVGVVASRNVVRMAVWLLFTLIGVALIYFLLGAEFAGAAQLIVYVGGTLVLVIFGVMLTAQGPFISMRTSPAEWAVATVVGLLLLGVLVVNLVGEFNTPKVNAEKALGPRTGQLPPLNPATSLSSVTLGESLLGVPEATPKAPLTGLPKDPPEGWNKAKEWPPSRTVMSYLLPFEIVSVHLLVVLIGAAYLARAKRKMIKVTANE